MGREIREKAARIWYPANLKRLTPPFRLSASSPTSMSVSLPLLTSLQLDQQEPVNGDIFRMLNRNWSAYLYSGRALFFRGNKEHFGGSDRIYECMSHDFVVDAEGRVVALHYYNLNSWQLRKTIGKYYWSLPVACSDVVLLQGRRRSCHKNIDQHCNSSAVHL